MGIGGVNAADATQRIYKSLPTDIPEARLMFVAEPNLAVILLLEIGREASVVTVFAPVTVGSPTPCGPCGPCAPVAPLGPVAPVAPFRFLKAKEKVLANAVPPRETVTEGVPMLASTVAVAPVILALAPAAPVAPVAPVAPFAPVSPLSPLSPFGPCNCP